MKENLKLLRDQLRRWNVDIFGKINLEVDRSIKELNILDLEAAKDIKKDVEGILPSKESSFDSTSKKSIC